MRLQLDNQTDLDFNRGNIGRILEAISTYCRINKVYDHDLIYNRGKHIRIEDKIVVKENVMPSFAYDLRMLYNSELLAQDVAIKRYMRSKELVQEYLQRNNKSNVYRFFHHGSIRKIIEEQMDMEGITLASRAKELYEAIKEYSTSEELIPVDYRIKKCEDAEKMKLLELEKKNNQGYDYDYLKQMHKLVMEELHISKKEIEYTK